MTKEELIARIKKTSTIKETSILSESKFLLAKDMIQTPIPSLNIILSGSLSGGFTPGSTMFAGPSKHFKTLFMLILMKSYLETYPESVAVLFDSEFGAAFSYFDSLGIDKDSVMHIPFIDIEQLKFEMMAQLETINKGDKIFFGLDSIGMSASKKETEDALDSKSVADMTRAKALKSLFRLITPRLTLKDIPLVSVNHTYQEIALHPRQIVGGGTGAYYGSDNIFIIGRQQEKEGTEITGYNFVINVEKSRFVREKSKISLEVGFDQGINKWSGLLDIALESGHVIKPKNGWYQKAGEEKNYREADTNTEEFWKSILNDNNFHVFVENKYKLGSNKLISE